MRTVTLDAIPLSAPQTPDFLVAHLDIWKAEPGFYSYTVTVDGRDDALMDCEGFNSIRATIEYAARDAGNEGPITAFEASYRGITGGTYTPARIARDADAIAEHLVATYASVIG